MLKGIIQAIIEPFVKDRHKHDIILLDNMILICTDCDYRLELG